jgi:hypothetical protein
MAPRPKGKGVRPLPEPIAEALEEVAEAQEARESPAPPGTLQKAKKARSMIWTCWDPSAELGVQLFYADGQEAAEVEDGRSATHLSEKGHYGVECKHAVSQEREAAAVQQAAAEGAESEALNDSLYMTETTALEVAASIGVTVEDLQKLCSEVEEAEADQLFFSSDSEEGGEEVGEAGEADAEEKAKKAKLVGLMRGIGGDSMNARHQVAVGKARMTSLAEAGMTKPDEAAVTDPQFGMMFKDMAAAACYAGSYGARTHPLRQLGGGSATKRTYVCKHTSSFFPSAAAQKKTQQATGTASCTQPQLGFAEAVANKDVCSCVMVFQRLPAASLLRGSYRMGDLQKQVISATNSAADLCVGTGAGLRASSGADADSDARTAAAEAMAASESSCSLDRWAPPRLAGLPDGVGKDTVVCALTFFSAHTETAHRGEEQDLPDQESTYVT